MEFDLRSFFITQKTEIQQFMKYKLQKKQWNKVYVLVSYQMKIQQQHVVL